MKQRRNLQLAEDAVAYSAALPPAYFRTDLGGAWLGKAEGFLPRLPDESVNLIFTSPPYALHFKKEYGNPDQDEYVDWFLGYASEFRRVLKRDGSLVINLGGSWQPGHPIRSLCHFEILIALVREHGFRLAQEFYWYNPAKLPAPAEWVTVRRIRVKDAVECLWWLSKTAQPKADNRRILAPYSEDMKRLLKRGYRAKERPSGHRITHKFTEQEAQKLTRRWMCFETHKHYLEGAKFRFEVDGLEEKEPKNGLPAGPKAKQVELAL